MSLAPHLMRLATFGALAFSTAGAYGQDLSPFSACGPVYSYRLEGDVCSRMRAPVPGSRTRLGDGVLFPGIGTGQVCCVTKAFAMQEGLLRRNTHEEDCGELFETWRSASEAGRRGSARLTFRQLQRTCPKELARVASTANVPLRRISRPSEPTTGQLGGALYGSMTRMSAAELEGVAAANRRDPSGNLSVADILSLGVSLGSAAAAMYPARRFYYDSGVVTPGRPAPRPLVQTLPRPAHRQSDITGTRR